MQKNNRDNCQASRCTACDDAITSPEAINQSQDIVDCRFFLDKILVPFEVVFVRYVAIYPLSYLWLLYEMTRGETYEDHELSEYLSLAYPQTHPSCDVRRPPSQICHKNNANPLHSLHGEWSGLLISEPLTSPKRSMLYLAHYLA